MSLSIGIIGLPNVGKSTLFNALTDNAALAANYPFATIDPNVGVVSVPDDRLQQLGTLYPDSPIEPATLHFTDIAGLVAGANQGAGLGNQFLSHIREVSAIAHVVPAFADPELSSGDEAPDPQQDIRTVETELILADIATIQKRREALEKPARTEQGWQNDITLLEDLLQALNRERLIRHVIQGKSLDEYLEEAKVSQDTATLVRQLLTAKPMIYVFNVDESEMTDEDQKARMADIAGSQPHVYICAKLEAELIELGPEEAGALLEEYGQAESGLVQLARTGYQALGLQSFFTAGETEVRAWTITAGATAPDAAGTIHTDMQRGFIAAEIINWQDLIDAGSKSAARTRGLLRREGKNYRMQEGDVAEFKFNT
jgi:GTP-binding protein YchF